ncbi:MAG: hypothetical protein GY884_16765, partial [Proteobacteria bacterium]|nr:hypothetical protein [Pseudomonadota bacterium]
LLLLLLVAGCAQPGPGVVGSQGLAVSSPITLLDDLGAAADVTVALGATDDYWADTIDGFDQRSAGDATFALAVDFDPTATGADEQALWGTNSDGQSWSLTYVPDEMELRLRWGDGLSESLVSRTLSTAELDAAELELVWSWTASTCSAQGVQTLWLDGVFAGRDATGNGIWSTGGIGALGVQLTHLEDGSGTDVTNVAFAAGTMDLTEGLQL